MANSLVNRLCQVETVPASGRIATNPFCEALQSVLGGYHTVAQVKNFYNMTAEDETMMDILVSRVTAKPDLTGRMLAVHRIRSILVFWETHDDPQAAIPGYLTPDDIEARFNEI